MRGSELPLRALHQVTSGQIFSKNKTNKNPWTPHPIYKTFPSGAVKLGYLDFDKVIVRVGEWRGVLVY